MKKHLHATVVAFLIVMNFSYLQNTSCHASQNGYTKTKLGSRSKLDLCFKNLTLSNNSQAIIYHKYLAPKYCLDVRLPHRTTIVPDYLPDFQSTEHVTYYLEKWEHFYLLPKCWQNLQATLCSIFMPQLDEDPTMTRATRVSRPSVDSCSNLVNNQHCKFIARHYGWPSIFNCSDSTIYAKNCSNEVREFRYKHPACPNPLVPSNDSSLWFKDVSGCTMHCKYPILDNKDQENIKYLIGILSVIGFIVTFTAVTNMDGSNEMLQVIWKCILLQPLFFLGWSLQTILGRDIACSPSGASLYGLPIVANACVLSFILTYLSMIHFSIWFAYMGEICYRELATEEHPNKDQAEVAQAFVAPIKEARTVISVTNKKTPEDETKKGTIVNWMTIVLPVILLIAVAFLGQIDGNGIYGICTVGQKSIIMKSLFVFTLEFICTIYGNIYLIRTIYCISQKKDIDRESKKNYYRIIAIVILSFAKLFLSICNHLYAYYNRNWWEDTIDKFVSCKMNPHISDTDYETDVMSRQECELDLNNLVPLYYLELISTLGLGMIIASWAYCDKNVRELKRKIINLLESKEDKIKRDYWNLMVNGVLHPDALDMLDLPQDQSVSRPPSSLSSITLRSGIIKKCGSLIKRRSECKRREAEQQELRRRESVQENMVPTSLICPDHYLISKAYRDREPPPANTLEFYFSIENLNQ